MATDAYLGHAIRPAKADQARAIRGPTGHEDFLFDEHHHADARMMNGRGATGRLPRTAK